MNSTSPEFRYPEFDAPLLGHADVTLTDQRCLILRLFPVHKVESFGPGEITRLDRTEKSDGSGNIIFSEDVKRGRRGSYLVPRGFYGITEVRRIEEEIEKLKQKGQQFT